jgi:hypothetical protein
MTHTLETEVPIGSKTYRVGRMSAFEQMHLIADCQTILSGLALLKRDRPKEMSHQDFANTIRLIVASTGRLPPEVRERVWGTCLRQVLRKEPGGWVPVMASADALQFTDIGPNEITVLIYAVFEHNKLLDFFSEGLSSSDRLKTTEGDGNGQRLEEVRIG